MGCEQKNRLLSTNINIEAKNKIALRCNKFFMNFDYNLNKLSISLQLIDPKLKLETRDYYFNLCAKNRNLYR